MHVSGQNNFTGTFDKKYTAELRAILTADLDQYLGAVLSVLPVGLQARLKADATDKLVNSDDGKANFVYRRYDLKMDAMSRLLPGCYAKITGNSKVVTGVSVVTMSGDWAYSRLSDSFGDIEATAEFAGLSDETKGKYTDKRNLTLNGKFEPLSFVIATAWRVKN